MSVFKNSIYSSTSELQKDPGYDSLTYSDNNHCKSKNENQFSSNNNNNIHRVDYITVAKSRQTHEPSTYLFWTLVVLLFVLAFGNLILTFVILGVLRLGQGMESLELVPEESLIKFFGITDLDNIYKRDGKLEGFNESPVEITSDSGNIHVNIMDTEREITPVMNFDSKFEGIENVEAFEVKHPVSGKSIFSTDFPNFGLPRGVDNLNVKLAITKRISSAVDENFYIKSESFVTLKGSEGVYIDGKSLFFSADQDIFFKSVNKSIILSADDGIFIKLRRIPITFKGKDIKRSHTQYKLCVCMPEGKLFRLPIPPGHSSRYSCHNIDESMTNNPCVL